MKFTFVFYILTAVNLLQTLSLITIKAYTYVGSSISMYYKRTLVYFGEYGHLEFSTPCPVLLNRQYVIVQFVLSLEYALIFIPVLAHVLRDLFSILHVTFLVASLHEKTKGAEEAVAIGSDLLQVEALLKDKGTHLINVACVFSLRLPFIVAVLLISIRHFLRLGQFVRFRVVLLLISFICSHCLFI